MALAGVVATRPELPYQQDTWAVGTDVAIDVVAGHCTKRHPSEPNAFALTDDPTDVFLFIGIVREPFGAVAPAAAGEPVGLDSLPFQALAARNVKVKFQDNATVVFNALLTFSAITDGTAVTATTGDPVFAICTKAITSGTVDQFTTCDLYYSPREQAP